MDLYLIKCGESIKDTQENFRLGLPDHNIYLTDAGVNDSKYAGIFLNEYLSKNNIDIKNAVMWVSPFLRARQTASIINDYLKLDNVNEDFLLIGQRCGLFSDKSAGRNRMEFEREFKFYDNYYKNDGEFYAKLPQGDSPLDVAVRTRVFLDMLPKEKNNPIFIVSHDKTIRTIIMNTFHYSPEWFTAEPKMGSCSIKVICDDKCDYIYGGPVKRL